MKLGSVLKRARAEKLLQLEDQLAHCVNRAVEKGDEFAFFDLDGIGTRYIKNLQNRVCRQGLKNRINENYLEIDLTTI